MWRGGNSGISARVRQRSGKPARQHGSWILRGYDAEVLDRDSAGVNATPGRRAETGSKRRRDYERRTQRG